MHIINPRIVLAAAGGDIDLCFDSPSGTIRVSIPRDLAGTLADEFRSLATAPSRCLSLDDEVLG